MGNGGALRGGGVGGAGDGLGLRGRGGLGGRWGFSVRWQCASAGWRCFSTGRRRVSAGRRRGGIRAGCAVSGAAGAGVVGVAGAVDGTVRVVTPDIVMLEGSGGFTVLGNDGRRVLVSLCTGLDRRCRRQRAEAGTVAAGNRCHAAKYDCAAHSEVHCTEGMFGPGCCDTVGVGRCGALAASGRSGPCRPGGPGCICGASGDRADAGSPRSGALCGRDVRDHRAGGYATGRCQRRIGRGIGSRLKMVTAGAVMKKPHSLHRRKGSGRCAAGLLRDRRVVWQLHAGLSHLPPGGMDAARGRRSP